MIISFTVSNFRSFSDETTFSMVASKRFQGHHESHLVPIPDSDEHLLKVGVIYGANGAGKSNLFRALAYMRKMVVRGPGRDAQTGREPFRLGAVAKAPSLFDVTFLLNKKVYRYGFKVDDERITEEWLVEVKGNRERALFERVTSSTGVVTIESSFLKKLGDKHAALATVGGPKNQTFLYTLRSTLEFSEMDPTLKFIISWFMYDLTLIAPTAPFRSLGGYMLRKDSFREFASRFLQAASTGVDRLEIEQEAISEEKVRKLLPERTAAQLISGSIPHAQTRDGSDIVRDPDNTGKYILLNIKAKHDAPNGHSIGFDLTEESDGTQRLLNLVPVLERLREESGIFFIDEIDRSMHPQLVWKFIEFFLKSCSGVHRQLLVTTHESNLLDLELLRRDEIWFAEKNQEGASQLYSLADFKVRKDLSIQKHYLQGRFGAIPFLGDIDRLIDNPKVHA